jgi:hypothetical protein
MESGRHQVQKFVIRQLRHGITPQRRDQRRSARPPTRRSAQRRAKAICLDSRLSCAHAAATSVKAWLA